MADIEQQALKIIAAECDSFGHPDTATYIRERGKLPEDWRMSAPTVLRLIVAALASQPQAQTGWSAEDACEQFIAAEIDAAPDCLRRLGDWLCNVLDEDRHKTAAAMVMGAILETSAAIREAQAPAAAVPDGWALVRKEPTRKILDDLRGLTFLVEVDDEALSEEWALLIAEAAAPAQDGAT